MNQISFTHDRLVLAVPGDIFVHLKRQCAVLFKQIDVIHFGGPPGRDKPNSRTVPKFYASFVSHASQALLLFNVSSLCVVQDIIIIMFVYFGFWKKRIHPMES